MSEQPPTPKPGEAEDQGQVGEPGAQPDQHEAQAEDPTSPLRGFEDPEDAEGQPGHAEDD